MKKQELWSKKAKLEAKSMIKQCNLAKKKVIKEMDYQISICNKILNDKNIPKSAFEKRPKFKLS